LQLFLFLFPLQHIKRPALRNKQVVVLRMAFRAGKVLGTFENRAPGPAAGARFLRRISVVSNLIQRIKCGRNNSTSESAATFN